MYNNIGICPTIQYIVYIGNTFLNTPQSVVVGILFAILFDVR